MTPALYAHMNNKIKKQKQKQKVKKKVGVGEEGI
jgi:hypothetical protein